MTNAKLDSYQTESLKNRIKKRVFSRAIAHRWAWTTDNGEKRLGLNYSTIENFCRTTKFSDETSRMIQHSGYYADTFCDNTYRGIVLYLPHNKFMAGYYDKNRECVIIHHIETYDDELTAAQNADTLAMREAEDAQEYDVKYVCDDAIAQLKDSIKNSRATQKRYLKALRTLPAGNGIANLGLCNLIKMEKQTRKAAHEQIKRITNDPCSYVFS